MRDRPGSEWCAPVGIAETAGTVVWRTTVVATAEPEGKNDAGTDAGPGPSAIEPLGLGFRR